MSCRGTTLGGALEAQTFVVRSGSADSRGHLGCAEPRGARKRRRGAGRDQRRPR